MEWYFILIIALAFALLIWLGATFSATVLIYKVIFGNRQDKNPNYKYFTAEEFGVNEEKFPVECNGDALNSNIYWGQSLENCEKVVIFQHGFGAGSASYITEIAHLVKAGFAVVATDAYGCNNSNGKDVRGFYSGAQAVIATFNAVKADARFNGKKVALVGHSWGAYSVLTALKRVKADGAVAMSAFDKPAQCTCDNLFKVGGVLKLYSKLLHANFWFVNLFKFGVNGNLSASRTADKSGVPALLIHGEKDGVVPLKHSPAKKAKGANVTKMILADKKHNPYNTVSAEAKLAALSDGREFESAEEEAEFYKNFDWAGATEEDASVMKKIDAFIENL